jgi:hypothetical protein
MVPALPDVGYEIRTASAAASAAPHRMSDPDTTADEQARKSA